MQSTKKYAKFSVIALCSILLISPAIAQDSWWEKAKKLLSGEDNVSQLVLSDEQIAKALKQALSVGSESVIKTLQQSGAFADNPNLHIDLPPALASAGKILDKIGMGQWTDELEAKLNEAAEQAIPAAGPIISNAINNLTLIDIQTIYNGENDAATQYFKSQMSGPIAQAMDPIIKQSLADVGALTLYDKIISKYQSLPFVPDISSDLIELVKTQALSGIFEYLAKEEAAIRENPEKRTTELLKKVFSK
ncbi:DUF4197 domain-containing protein [Cognaticolwellia beringensis]|uniref:DUF4197 domain-containing protein n=1 Tax=Cognaticolwellia beringensis TaxID=1967665 RepID=A0A222G9C3_9GAMM|nr:DUF4197 domain-containing protein [Cognaticolwellia beringensis]ASP48467.1 DUF4197 domain-containing protein [Cognaticolwellia beringensis]